MKFREKILPSGARLLMGKDERSNDELMKEFEGKENIVLHTSSPGSPFCVIENLNPGKKDVYEAGIVCARYSQGWRDNKDDVKVDVFTGRDISKPKKYKPGSWKVKKSKKINIKKSDILKFEGENDTG